VKVGATAGMVGSLAGCAGLVSSGGADAGTPNQGSTSSHDHFVPPGEHDEYYGFWSGGHSGEIRVMGIPSMRELMRIPVFNVEGARGYGFDDQTSEMLEESGGYTWGDNHHPALSETDGDYDGRWLFVNDKASGRIARVSLKYFETDAITDVPNVQAVHGFCVQSLDTEYLFGNGEFRTPLPNDGRDLENPEEYVSLFSALDPETMETLWQVKIDGDLDILDTDKDGRWAISSAYNSEAGTDVQEMTHDDRDWVKAFDVPAI
jgi:nitrous-oxide reductase